MIRTAIAAAALAVSAFFPEPLAQAAAPADAAVTSSVAASCPAQSAQNSAVGAQAFSAVDGTIPRAVVLVHGWDSSSSSMASVAKYVSSSTNIKVPVRTFLFDYGAHSGHWAAVPAIASCLADYVRTVSDASKRVGGDGKVILVGHSMGGLAIRFASSPTYAAHPLTANILAGVVTIDTPHLGSPWGGTPDAKLIQTFTQLKNGNGLSGLLPTPNGDGQLCLITHHGAIQGQPCATPSWLPAGVPIAEIAGDITIHRKVFGFELYARDTEGDGIVTRVSSTGYLPDSGIGHAPAGVTPTTYVDRCDVSEGDVLGNPISTYFNGLVSSDLAVLTLGDQPLTSPLMGPLSATALTAGCGHTNIINPAADPKAAADVVAAVNADLAKLPAQMVTQVSTVTPFFDDGRVRLPLDTQGGYFNVGFCSASPSATVADVYTCGGTAASLPACWPDPAGSINMYCMHAPGDNEVVRTSRPSDLTPAPADGRADPWQIVLDDGTTCDVRLGGAWPIPPTGYYYSYSCDGSVGALVVSADAGGTLIKATAHWSAHATVSVDDNPPVVTVGIKRVVYAGAAPTVRSPDTGAACPSTASLQAALPHGSTIDSGPYGGVRCVGSWARATYSDGENAYVGLFRQTSGRWRKINLAPVCTLPSPLPAALYPMTCLVS